MELADLTRGMRKNNFAKLGLSLSFTIAVPKTIFEVAENCFCVVPGLTPAIPAKRFIPFHSARGMRKDNFSEPKNCFSAKPDSSVSSAMVSRSFLATAVLLFTG